MKSAQSATTVTQKVNKEAVRLLVIQEGVREAARIAGLNENTVLSWAHRYGWSKPAIKTQSNGHSALVERVSDELADNERKTKLSLSRYAQRASQDAEKASLRDSPYVKQVAQVAAITHRWDAKEQQSNTVVNVAILGVDPASVQVSAELTLDVDTQNVDS